MKNFFVLFCFCMIFMACNSASEDIADSNDIKVEDIHQSSITRNLNSDDELEGIEYKSFIEENAFSLEYPDVFDTIYTSIDDNDDPYAGALIYWFVNEEITFFTYPLYPSKKMAFPTITVDKEMEILSEPLQDLAPDHRLEILESGTCEAMDSSYIREYIKDEYAFSGIIYQDKSVRKKYLKAFQHFANSSENLSGE